MNQTMESYRTEELLVKGAGSEKAIFFAARPGRPSRTSISGSPLARTREPAVRRKNAAARFGSNPDPGRRRSDRLSIRPDQWTDRVGDDGGTLVEREASGIAVPPAAAGPG